MSYFEAKQAALRHEPYYDFRVGPGYEEIPVKRIYAGFATAFDDLRAEDADTWPAKRKNLPQFRGALSVHTDDGLREGYYAFDEEVVAMDLAPDFVKARIPGWGQIARCLRGESSLPLPIELNTQKLVGETDAYPEFRGNALGLLFDEPFLGKPHKGKLPGVYRPK